jgi:hypothetical protein
MMDTSIAAFLHGYLAKDARGGQVEISLDKRNPQDLGIYSKLTGDSLAPLAAVQGVGSAATKTGLVGAATGTTLGVPLLQVLRDHEGWRTGFLKDIAALKLGFKSGASPEAIAAYKAALRKHAKGGVRGGLVGAGIGGALVMLSNLAKYNTGRALAWKKPEPK